MIVVRNETLNGRAFTVATSDSGYMIERDGALYSEAWDFENSGRTYTETDILIEVVEEDATEDDYLKALDEFGVR